jgi:hypothetical protein
MTITQSLRRSPIRRGRISTSSAITKPDRARIRADAECEVVQNYQAAKMIARAECGPLILVNKCSPWLS